MPLLGMFSVPLAMLGTIGEQVAASASALLRGARERIQSAIASIDRGDVAQAVAPQILEQFH